MDKPKLDELAQSIHMHFLLSGYEWKIGGESRLPEEEEIKEVLIKALEALDNAESNDVQLDVGRLILRKEGTHTDIYVHFGEL